MKHVRVLTLNACAEDEQIPTRHKALVEFIKEESYDVVCLQECTGMLHKLLTSTLSDREYQLSPPPDYVDLSRVCRYGAESDTFYYTLILCKAALSASFSRNELTSCMHRDLLLCELYLDETDERDSTRRVILATTHLESLNTQDIRKRQLAEIHAIFSSRFPRDDVILMGDFNFGSERNYRKEDRNQPLHNTALIEHLPSYVDMWSSLNPRNKGYTFEFARNKWRFEQDWDVTASGYRFDRVMARLLAPHKVRIQELRLSADAAIGVAPATKFRGPVPLYLSDHLGLEFKLEIIKDSTRFRSSITTELSAHQVETFNALPDFVNMLMRNQTGSMDSTDQQNKRTRTLAQEEDSDVEVIGETPSSLGIVYQELLGEEPSADTPHVAVHFLLSDGKTKHSRRFHTSSPVEALFWYVQTKDPYLREGHFVLRISGERVNVERSEDKLDSHPELQGCSLRTIITS